MAAKCRKFEPNVFNKTKCGVCFKSRNDHSASALESAKAARKLLKYGYLFIAPDVSARRWQRRFFVLYDDGELSYAVDENVDTVPQGIVDMNQCEDVFDAEQSSGHEFSFGVAVPPETHYIKGTNREEVIRWMDLLSVYPTENALNKANTKPFRHTQSSSQEDVKEVITAPPVVEKEPSPERPLPSQSSTDPRPQRNSSNVSNGTPALSSHRQRTKSTPQLPAPSAESDDDLADKFLKEDWYKPINNNQSSLGNLNAQKQHQRRHTDVSITSTDPQRRHTDVSIINTDPQRRHTDVSITNTDPQRRHTDVCITNLDPQRRRADVSITSSESKTSLSSRQSTGLLGERTRLAKDRRKTQPEIRYTENSGDVPDVPDVSSMGRRRSSTDSCREVAALALRGATDGAPGGPPPAEKRRSRLSESKADERDESKMSKVIQDPSRTSQGSTDSEGHVYMKKGWLHKLTPTGEWSKHWFVLCGQALKYYRDSRAEEINDLDGRIDLKYCKEVREVDASKNYGLQIKNRNGSYTLSAMTSGIRSNWIHAISTYVNDEAQSEPLRRNSKPQLQRRNTVPEVLLTDLQPDSKSDKSSPELSPTRKRNVDRSDSNTSSVYNKDRSQLVVEGRPSPDTRLRSEDGRGRLDSVASDVSERSTRSSNKDDILLLVKREQDPKLTGKSPIEKKLDKLRSKVVSRSRSPPPKLASEVLKKAAESPDSGAVVQMLETEVDHLQGQLEKAHDEMVSLHDENSKLKSKFKHAKKKIKEAEESGHHTSHINLDDQIRELQTEKAANVNEKSLLKLEMENVRQENDILHCKVRKLTDENGTLKRSFQGITNENASIRGEMKSLQSQMAKLQDANTGKRDELTELVQRVDEYRSESRKHKKSCREKESQILEISEELQHKCEDYEDLTRKYNLILNEIDKNKSVKVGSMKLERENANLRQELDQKTQDYSDVMNRYNELASEYQNLKSSLDGTKKITSNYVSNLKEHETLIKNLRQELENRTIDLSANEKQKTALEVELKDAKMTLKDSLHILDSQKSRVDEKDKQIVELKKGLEERIHEHDEMVNKYEDLLSKHSSLVKTSETGEAGQKDEITRLNDLLEEKTHTYHDLEDKYNDLLCEFEKAHDLSLLDQLDEREDEVEKLREEVHERTDDCEELALRVDRLEKELANTRMTLMEQESGKPQMLDFGCSPDTGEGVLSVCVQVWPGDVMDLCTSACQTLPSADVEVEVATASRACPLQACSVEPVSPSIVDKLKQQIHQSERNCDELDVRNSALKLQINQMMDRYHEEVKFYSGKIDDLVRKLRAEQGKKKESSLEAMLSGLEKQIEGAEKAIQMQASVEDTLTTGLTRLLDEDSSETNSERTISPEVPEVEEPEVEKLDEQKPERDPESEGAEKFDDELLTRIQSLHDRVALSNDKLTQLFSMIEARDDESESVSSLDVNGRLKSFEDRLSSIHCHLRAHETRTATTESLKSLVENHDRTLSVLDECETGLLTSLSSLNKTEHRRDQLKAVVKTVNGMMEFANREREVILENKRQIEQALSVADRRSVKDGQDVNVYAENVALKSLMAGRDGAANRAQEADFIRERDQYFLELQDATQRIGELEDTVDYLRSKYAQTRHNDVLLSLSDAVETYANVIAEGIVHHGLAEVSRNVQLKDGFCEREGLVREVRVANSKIRELENTVEFQLSDREKLSKAQSFNHYVSLIGQQSDHHDVMFKDYQRNMGDLRHQQLTEFSQFTERLKSIEDKIGTMILGRVDLPQLTAPSGGDKLKEDWSVFSQAACLVGKAMGQAELVLKLHQLRDTILACSTRHDQLRLFNREIELSLSRLRSREKLMTDNVDKYKSEKLENVSELVVKHGLEGMSLTQALHALIDKLNHLVGELSSFYKSMDMVGDQADLQSKLDACINKEIELVNSELEQNCQGKRKSSVDLEPMSPELLSSLLYNLADLLAQRAMVEAQFQYVTDQHQKNKNFILPITKDESRPSSALSLHSVTEGAQPIFETRSSAQPTELITQSLPLPSTDRRHSDVLVTNAACSSPAARSPTTTSSDSSTESESETESEDDIDGSEVKTEPEVKVVTEIKVDLKATEPLKMVPSSTHFQINHKDELLDYSMDARRDPETDEDCVFAPSGDEVDYERNTPDVFKFLHDPDFASSLRDPDLDAHFHMVENVVPIIRTERTCASESDVLDSAFEIVDYSGNIILSTSAPALDKVDHNNTHNASNNNSAKSRRNSLPHAEQPSVHTESTLSSRMRAAEAKNRLHRSPAFRRRVRQGDASQSTPDLSDLSLAGLRSSPKAKANASPISSKPPPSRSAGRRTSTPDLAPTKSHHRRGSTPDLPKTPVRIPHSETRKVYVKSLRKPPPLKRGSPPKLTSPKRQEDRFVVSFGLSRGPVPEPSNDIF